MYKTLWVSVWVSLLLTACASQPGSQAYLDERADKLAAARASELASAAKAAPDWYVTPPMAADALYGAATGVSGDMQMAVDKAVLSGKRLVADQLQNKVVSQMKEFLMESGTDASPMVTQEAERVTTSVLSEAEMMGYIRERTSVQATSTGFRAYVLIRLPLGEANKVVMAKIKQSALLESRVRASRAYQALDAVPVRPR